MYCSPPTTDSTETGPAACRAGTVPKLAGDKGADTEEEALSREGGVLGEDPPKLSRRKSRVCPAPTCPPTLVTCRAPGAVLPEELGVVLPDELEVELPGV